MLRMKSAAMLVVAALSLVAASGMDSAPELALRIADYAALPITGLPDGSGNNAGSLARINFMREEPAPAHRFFVNDLNGPLYILDRTTKKATVYLDFNGRAPRTGLFEKLPTADGLASGFVSFQFDPDYATNGKFYTIHDEDLEAPGGPLPRNAAVPGLIVAGYTPTTPIRTPGTVDHESVLIEWTDTNISNSTFEGTARELLRIPLFSRIHPVGDLVFNPTARRGDPDWRVLYVGCGDGGSGEQKTSVRLNPQRLDTMAGKILRIIPDLSEHADASTVSENGRYRIPRDNPFASIDGARKEVWAYGLRNPHRLSWDVNPANPKDNQLLAAVIGLRTWETVVIVHRGANYGYSEREGNEALLSDNVTGKLPEPDTISVRVTDTITHESVTPTYPVLQYGHTAAGGVAIAGGFVYRGKAVPGLRGKYVFGDISTGRVWYANYSDMIAADDRDPRTLAEIHELHLRWNDPADTPDRGEQLYDSMSPIVSAAYHTRGGKHPVLPGDSRFPGFTGRVDLRFALDGDGELYLLSKSDGMIRRVVGVTPVRQEVKR
jgi:Glucose / Sorbosone dehydrogenase